MDDDGDSLTYSMEGTDAASFTFDASARQIQTKTGVTYNHEEKSTYSVTVKADDDNGGTATVVVTITVTDVAEQPATPAKPTLAVVSSTSLTATWVKPGLNGGPDITGYNVNYRVSTATAWETFTHSGAGVTRTITGLTASTSYQVRVRALNGETASAWSDPSEAVSTNTAADTPTVEPGSLKTGSRRSTVRWTRWTANRTSGATTSRACPGATAIWSRCSWRSSANCLRVSTTTTNLPDGRRSTRWRTAGSSSPRTATPGRRRRRL